MIVEAVAAPVGGGSQNARKWRAAHAMQPRKQRIRAARRNLQYVLFLKHLLSRRSFSAFSSKPWSAWTRPALHI